MGSSILITKVIIIKMASNQLIQTKLELQKLSEEKEEMERQLTEVMEEKIQDMKVEVESIGESLEAMEEKIQDMKVEGIENIRVWIEKSRKIHLFTELESRLASIKKRLELMDEHAFAGRKALVQMDLFFFTFLEVNRSMDLDEKEDLKLRLLKF